MKNKKPVLAINPNLEMLAKKEKLVDAIKQEQIKAFNTADIKNDSPYFLDEEEKQENK